MKKLIIVNTNDPENAKFSLKVTGPVERVATISPASVYLYGEPGQTLESEIKITPSEKYPFKILEMNHLKNSGVDVILIEPKDVGSPWIIKLSATAPRVTNLFDHLTIRTDSKFRPTLRVRVSVMFVEPDEKTGQS